MKLAYSYKDEVFWIQNFLSNDYYKLVHSIIIKNRNLINITKGSQRIEVIGSAHNQYEYFIKERQGCSTIFLSPIFYNKKYSLNKILYVHKFNLITLNWKKSIGALGGINFKNLKLIKLIRSKSIGIKSLITK